MIPAFLKVLALGLVAYEGTIYLQETGGRKEYWYAGRAYCDRVEKPMLQIGKRNKFWEPPNADVVIDIDPAVLEYAGGLVADERDIPFLDRHFGVCYNSHTLEHLNSPEDIQQAVDECCRVADYAVFLCPSPRGIVAGILHPDHKYRLFFEEGNRIVVKQMLCVGQAIVTPWDYVPEVIYEGK
jgi:hypothetical protein